MDAYEQLLEGMIDRTPSCHGLDAFTADYIDADDRAILSQICASCDLQLLCQKAAAAERPDFGFWAGQYHGPKYRPSKRAA